jgi:glycosyltransferase involved in cell wall biosynthesis
MARVLLATFDVVPSHKGAGQHVLRNAEILAHGGHEVSLVSLGRTPVPGLRHRTIPLSEPNLVRRALAFRAAVARVLEAYTFDVHHVRSPWEGLAVPAGAAIAYEVNGLPSVELPDRFPALHARPEVIRKLRMQEDRLLDRASLVVTPSPVTREHLVDRGVDRDRIVVVPNAPSFAPRSPRGVHEAHEAAHAMPTVEAPLRLVYVGTLARWQGIHAFVRAMPKLRHPAVLSVVTPAPEREAMSLAEAAAESGVSDCVRLFPPLDHAALGEFLAKQHVGVAPLTPCARNLVQGAMPIKILDYLAAGLPVLAPAMPITAAALGEDYPLYDRAVSGSMVALCDALAADPAWRARLAAQGHARVTAPSSREAQARALLDAYRRIASSMHDA